jgi:lipopolysaccharide/colanic/teichoic acid biosynthesis glycosyltransferase
VRTRGLDYLLDTQRKDHLEVRLQTLAAPVLGAMTVAGYVAASVDQRSLLPSKVLIRQDRVGFADELLAVTKIRTLPNTREAANKSVGTFNNLASSIGHMLRVSGVDESVQRGLLGKDMHLVGGYRPELQRDLDNDAAMVDELRERKYWRHIVNMYNQNQEARTMTKPALLGLAPLYGHYKLGRSGEENALPESERACKGSDEEIAIYRLATRIALENVYYHPIHGANAATDLRIVTDTPRILIHASRGSVSVSDTQPWLPAGQQYAYSATHPSVLEQYLEGVQELLPPAL